MNIRMNTGGLDETESDRTFRSVIVRGFVNSLYELALYIPFFSEAMDLIDTILAETTNDKERIRS